MTTLGYRELNKQLKAMAAAPAGRALRSAAMTAMLPALRAAQAAAPVGDPPYTYGQRSSLGIGKRGRKAGTSRTESARTIDPYPVKSYKGRYRTPGFASRNVARKSRLSRDKSRVIVMLGVKPEAFYAVSFFELGTSSISRNPWLEPSFRASIPQVDARFREQLKKRIDKSVLKRR